MPTNPMGQIPDSLRREKNLDETVIIAGIEEAIVEAVRKQFNAERDSRPAGRLAYLYLQRRRGGRRSGRPILSDKGV